MHDRRREVEARLTRALAQRVRPAERSVLGTLSLEAWDVPPADDGAVGEPVRLDDALEQRYEPVEVGHRWGPAWGTTWFHVTGTVPDHASDPELWLDLGWDVERPGFQAEALVRRRDGSVVKGLNPQNSWLPCSPGEEVDLWVEAAANPRLLGPDWFRPTDEGDRLTSWPQPLYAVRAAQVCERHGEVVALGHDLEVLDGLMRTLPDDDARRWELVVALERSLDLLDHGDVVGTASRARAALADVLAAPARASAHRVSAVGHAHIDSAWLWPVRETVRKVLRTVANVVHLLDTRDDLVYAMSSAQQWDWVRRHDPVLFEQVREHVRAGRFVPVGGMWVESDTNMVGGEAMARQLVVGQGWFAEHLGTTCEEVWLPDSFGYTAALPQLVRLAGCRWFLTQKISWNTVNHFPHHTFWWEGIDGTRVFTHFPPVDTYTSELSAAELAHAASNFRDKGVARRSLVPFGHGDGGGGPTREMLERASRTADLEGSPQVVIESPTTFFEQAHEEYADAPTWVGELYLEMHRGTYTSQALTKRGNRRAEHLLREAELWWTTAYARGLAPYPVGPLRRAWQTVLLHQFHDILPGSSIAWVHREAASTYAALHADLEALVDAALDVLVADQGGTDDVVLNAGPFARDGVGALGAAVATHRTEVAPVVGGEHIVLDDGRFRVAVAADGAVTSLVDLARDREVVAPGGAVARLELHPDTPNAWDAWDLDGFYRHTSTRLAGTAEPDGDAVVVRYAFGGSTASVRLSLHPDHGLELALDVDWHEREAVLKLAHDLDVHADSARYETQFGHVVRPTHENTSWDAARFEVCAHRWVHVGETGYGVAVANDSTYGHDVSRHPREGGGTSSTVRLTVLRAPRYPDPDTDQGRHQLRCAVVPGADVLAAAAAGYALNLPLRVRRGGPVEPLVRLDGDPVLVEAVKLAEDGSGDVVVRLYEPQGARAAARLLPSFAVGSVTETDLLERPLAPDALVATDDGAASLRLRPFQVVTLRLAVAS
ncbi:glycoside hydrolase family 38 C-terminal domain-containing protein [Angustibacter speluncae]